MAIGSPLLGYLADCLKKRQSAVLFGAGLALTAILLVIYSPYQSLLLLEISLFLFGLGSGTFMLGFVIGKEINKAALAATVVALINTGDAISARLSEPLVGKNIRWIMDRRNGERNSSFFSSALSDSSFVVAY